MTKRAAPIDDDRKRDEELGMSQPITRRDLLQGVIDQAHRAVWELEATRA